MSDLILRTQLEVLNENLNRLQTLSDVLVRRRGEKINSAVKCLFGSESVDSSIERIEETVLSIIKRYKAFLMENNIDDDLLVLGKDEKVLREEIGNARNTLYRAKKNVEKMQDRSVNEAGDLRDIACRHIENDARECIQIVTDIKKKIEAASRIEGNSAGEAERLRQEAWTEYYQRLHKKSQEMFTEYVDFLRGLAMRDEGLDEGICQIVDTLIAKCKIVDVDPSLSIPDRREAVSMTLARIIRVGFPEWSIWAIPLTVHELGHIAVYGKDLQDFIQKKVTAGVLDTHCLEEILSDAVATYLIGPAYACAAILMRFNPASAHDEGSEHTVDAKRAYIILDMLDWMNSQVSDRPYSEIIEKLKGEWTAALRQAKQPEELKTNEKEQLDKWKTPVDADGREVIRKIVKGGYAVQSWRRSMQLSDVFRDCENCDDIQPDLQDDLVTVLNAAWLSRSHCPQDADKIEKAARTVWNKIALARRQPGIRQTLTGRRD